MREWIGLESPGSFQEFCFPGTSKNFFGEGRDWAGEPWVFERVFFMGPPKIFGEGMPFKEFCFPGTSKNFLVREWIGLESPGSLKGFFSWDLQKFFGEGMDWAGEPWVFERVFFMGPP